MEATYRIELDQFSGPLDLLLYLIKSQEIDIYDIPVAKVADQYLEYVDTLAVLDLNVASEFLVLAATLVELKSKVLLPAEPGDETDDLAEVEDPRNDLVRKLLDYKRFRDLAERLEDMMETNESRFTRGGNVTPRMAPPDPDDDEELGIEASLWDLLASFKRLMADVAQNAPRTIVYDDTPISVHMQRVTMLLRDQRVCRFVDLFEGRRDKGFIIGTFLALLELCKLKALRAEEGEGLDLLLRYTAADDFDPSDYVPTSILGKANDDEEEEDEPTEGDAVTALANAEDIENAEDREDVELKSEPAEETAGAAFEETGAAFEESGAAFEETGESFEEFSESFEEEGVDSREPAPPAEDSLAEHAPAEDSHLDGETVEAKVESKSDSEGLEAADVDAADRDPVDADAADPDSLDSGPVDSRLEEPRDG